jgi:hypothetical protein
VHLGRSKKNTLMRCMRMPKPSEALVEHLRKVAVPLHKDFPGHLV